MTKEINILALAKGEERYIFLFEDDNRTEILRQIGHYAANPDLSFTWYDAAVMSQKIRQTAPKQSHLTDAFQRSLKLSRFQRGGTR